MTFEEAIELKGKSITIKTTNGLTIIGAINGFMLKDIKMDICKDNVTGITVGVGTSIRFNEIKEYVINQKIDED